MYCRIIKSIPTNAYASEKRKKETKETKKKYIKTMCVYEKLKKQHHPSKN